MFIKFMHVPLESIKTNPRSEFDVDDDLFIGMSSTFLE